MEGDIVVIGYGPVGKATVALLKGRAVRVAQRSAPKELPQGVTFSPCDMLDAASVREAAKGAAQIVLAVGFPYDSAIWRTSWPKAMANVLDAAEKARARVVFVDNLYMYGPQTASLREDMALQDFGAKPAVRAAITRQWMTAHTAGRVKITALRAPDFYGPGVTQSHLGDLALGNLTKGKKPMVIVDPDQPHAFAYVPDIARGVVSLLDAPDPDFGQAWHIPSAPMRTTRQILEIGAKELGQKLAMTAIPMRLLPVLGLFMPFMKEMAEMRFQWDRPYDVDASKFAQRFWPDYTPLEVGVIETMRAFRESTAR
jgi:nucleoside-diphosphate-sugar epimerase